MAWGIFTEVFVAFVPIGHTHEDIDQFFSRTARRLDVNKCIKIQDLQKEVSNCYIQ